MRKTYVPDDSRVTSFHFLSVVTLELSGGCGVRSRLSLKTATQPHLSIRKETSNVTVVVFISECNFSPT